MHFQRRYALFKFQYEYILDHIFCQKKTGKIAQNSKICVYHLCIVRNWSFPEGNAEKSWLSDFADPLGLM